MQSFSFRSTQNKNQKSSSSTRAQKKQSPFFKPFIQPKLAINQPNDIYEQEADAMTERVMRMTANKNTFFKPANISFIQRKCAHCEEEEKLQTKEEGGASGGITVPPIVHNVINSGGQQLDAGTRNFMESRFGYDFGNVLIHNNALAYQSSKDINALSYTHGNHVVFAEGQYQPNTNRGKQLLAHELTHVIQQGDVIRPYRTSPSKDKTKDKKKSFNFGKNDTALLIEDSFDTTTDMETKPWIELITVSLQFQMTDKNGYDTWVGEAQVKYYDNGVKLSDFSFPVTAGSEELGMSDEGKNFTVTRIEGIGYNSGKYSGKYIPASKKGWGRRYSKDLNSNMSYAVFYHGNDALHAGPLDQSSHGCVHVDWYSESTMQQVNYHSVIGLTKVKVGYP